MVTGFHHDLRWRYRDSAAAHVDPRFASDFVDALDDMKDDLHITNWEIRKVELSPDGLQAKIRVRMQFYHMPSTVVRDEVIHQVWKQIEGKWFLVSQEGGPFEFPPAGAKPDAPTGQDGGDKPEDSPGS